MIIKCNLSDYYDTGIKLDQSLSLLLGIHNHDSYLLSKLKETKKTREKMLFINMTSLGLIDGPSNKPVITPRGYSFLCGRILYLNKITSDSSLENHCARLALLKAIADIDWRCFTKMIWLEDVEGLSWREVHKYYRYDTERNFKHRRGLHRTVSREIGFSKILKKLNFKSFSQIELLNPYNESFKAQEFFPFKIRSPDEHEILSALNESLAIYKKLFREHKPFGFTELLKMIMVVLLLQRKFYCLESQICKSCVKEMYEKRITLFRSSRPLKLTGRGFYLRKRNDLVIYPFFRLKL